MGWNGGSESASLQLNEGNYLRKHCQHISGQQYARDLAARTIALFESNNVAWAMLQEAACICEGRAKPVMDLPNRDKDSLWEAIAKVNSSHCTISLFTGNTLV